MFKFIHAADLHLDSTLRGLARYDGAPLEEAHCATRRAVENLVELSLREQVSFVLIAGDLYDGDWRDYSTGLFFVNQMRRLREADIPVRIVAGNHDAVSQITKSMRLPDNVVILSDKHPQTSIIDTVDVAIHGQSFATRAVTTDLAASYPSADRHLFTIGLLHTSITGRPGHEPYAPCSVDELRAKGYDYWALGHVHAREVVATNPWVVFSGNTQGRHARETGEKGCSLVSVEGGQVIAVEHRNLAVIRWEVREVDLSAATDPDDVLASVAHMLGAMTMRMEEHPHALRIHLVGTSSVYAALLADPAQWIAQIRALATDLGHGQLWIEKVIFDLKPHSVVPTALQEGLGTLLQSLQAYDPTDEDLVTLANEFKDLLLKLPAEFRQSEEGIDLLAPTTLRQALNDAKSLLTTRLYTDCGT